MIKIGKEVIKNQHNFWNNCLFHPTDAVEEAWGKLKPVAELKADEKITLKLSSNSVYLVVTEI